MQTIVSTKQKTGILYNILGNRYVVFVCRFLLGGVFFVSSIGKLVDIEKYSVDVVYDFGVLPMVLARPFGLVMPFIEMAVALGLLLGILTRLSGLGGALMSIAFFIAKGMVLSQGREIDCGCFGAIVGTLASVTIYMDIPMLLFGIIIMFAPDSSRHWLALGNRLSEAMKKKFKLVW